MSENLDNKKRSRARLKIVESQEIVQARDTAPVIARVADKWTMIVIEVLAAHGALRFTQLASKVAGISQKMLTQTLRDMEREGLVTRTVYPVVPPKVEYQLTDLGLGLGAAFCGVWVWAEQNLDGIEQARAVYDARNQTGQ